MSRTLMAVLALTAAAACAAAAATNTTAQSPSESQIVGEASNRLADASATMAVPPAVSAATAHLAAEPAQYTAPAGAPTPVAASAAMTCEIRATRTADGVRLEGFAHASGPMSGTYDLVVTKSGSAGSSDINQGGEFDTASAPSASLGVSEISVEPGARLHARLTVHGDNGTVCRDELRS